MPNADGTLTDQERLDLYTQCQANKSFDIIGAVNFFVGLATADVQAIAQPFIDGIGQKGCDVFLTDAQISARDNPPAPVRLKGPPGLGPAR
jgi:hypothetical protein